MRPGRWGAIRPPENGGVAVVGRGREDDQDTQFPSVQLVRAFEGLARWCVYASRCTGVSPDRFQSADDHGNGELGRGRQVVARVVH